MIKKCPQIKCQFNQFGGCKNCIVCGCSPNEINDNCDKCHNCAFDEGILRWEDEESSEKQELINKIKEQLTELKALEEPKEDKKPRLVNYCN